MTSKQRIANSKKTATHTLLFLLLCFIVFPAKAQTVVDLAGIWDFAQGDSPDYTDHVMLPGSMLTNDKGDDVDIYTQWTGSLYDSSYYFNPYMEKYRQPGEMKFPFFLTPRKHYVGNAWYRRSFYVPSSLKGQRITLFLERPHIETTVFVNGESVGHQLSLSTPHVYDVTKQIRPGEKNEVAIRVYNGIENVCVGQDSHSVTDQTQGNWNGIVGKIELQARPKKLNIKQVKVIPNVKEHNVKVIVMLENHYDGIRILPIWDYFVVAEAAPLNGSHHRVMEAKAEALSSKVELTISLGKSMLTWDEFNPVVYGLTVRAGDDVYETQFGMREISTDGRQFYLNGHPIWLRGTVENCCFPETGYPPTDEDEWFRIFRRCKEYGINHVRFHSYCPPEAAFAAADIIGIYLQPEGPSWPNHGVKLRRGQKIDEYLLEESKRIVDTYGNHPSFLMMAAGNEPAGDWVSYCNEWVRQMKAYDPTKVYCGASVGGGWAWDDGSEYHVKGGARGLDWDRHAPQSCDDYYDQILLPRNYRPSHADSLAAQSTATSSSPSALPGTLSATVVNTAPVIAHEQGQWCAFPDFKEITQYNGAYKAGNFEIFRDLLRDGGMESQAEKFLMASGKLQTLCYKFEIERNLRTPDYAGFQLLGLNDYSGQGTALVGPLNVFWQEKGYVDAQQWREFCAPVVILARFPRFIYTTADTLSVPVEIYNACADFKQSRIGYAITTGSDTVIANTISESPVFRGKNQQVGTVDWVFSSVARPTKFTLNLSIEGIIRNHYDFWVYPAEDIDWTALQAGTDDDEATARTDKPLRKKTNVYVTDTLDDHAIKQLRKGGNVLLLAAGKVTLGSDVVQNYLPVFWNTSWFKMRPPHTTGAYIDVQHPLFRWFPTDSWSNINWWELLNRAQVMNLCELPQSYQSPIQPIDTWHVSRKLGMMVEAQVLNGKLLMTTMDVSSDLSHRIVARSMRNALIAYMRSNSFQPSLRLELKTVSDFFTKKAPTVNMYTNDSPDELKPKLK